MKTVKTSDLSGIELDYAVESIVHSGKSILALGAMYSLSKIGSQSGIKKYHSNWGYVGEIVESKGISVQKDPKHGQWYAHIEKYDAECDSTYQNYGFWGESALIAAMRCYVASKLGDSVEIPA